MGKSGQIHWQDSLTSALDFSSWLSLNIENRFRKLSGWEESAPVAIGSWGRGELCPGSDLDVIFCGDTQAVGDVVKQAEEWGMKLRYRVPENIEDWSIGVAYTLFATVMLYTLGQTVNVAAPHWKEMKRPR